ncbi:MAG TPA: hypothetical protein VK500_03735 [Nitrospiraceae bacterium]|nr:hypothetical protein [Nitrospiraceae bacterium]
MPALDAVPPSVPSLDGGGALAWLHADGTIVTVHKARSRKTAASLKRQASRGRLDNDEYVFTDNPPSSTERAERQWLTPGHSLTIQR